MIVIRDEKRMGRMATIGRYTSFLGMAALLGGFALAFLPEGTFADTRMLLFYQLLALSGGWLISQVGMYLSHRYVRSPRPDEVLDDTLRKVAKGGRLYHYALSAPHILLMPYGLIVINAKYQGGEITYHSEKQKVWSRRGRHSRHWMQHGVGMRKYFGQEGIGKPDVEIEKMVQSVAAFLNKNAPEVQEIPIAPMIVFTTKGVDQLDLKKSPIPAMHFKKVRGFLKQKENPPNLSEADYNAVRAALDAKAGERAVEEAEEA